MTLTERYLKAVAAQLPKASREDIVAELRDAIQTRMEDREQELGRPLSEADEEAVLREFGHPLSVAARYGSGPQHVVGPELYPWWMFGVKVALAAMLAITVIGALARVLVGDEFLGQAIGQAFSGAFSSAITIIGFATIAGFIIERQKEKPAFLREWRVKELGLFELSGFDPETVSRRLSETGRIRPTRNPLSPTARALASAACWVVILLWWTGVLNVSGLRVEDFGTVSDGVDYAALLGETARLLYWPVVIYAAGRILFDLSRAARPDQIRLAAFGDIGFGTACVALYIWLWQVSPLSAVIRVDTADAFIERVRAMFAGGLWTIGTILMLCVAFGLVSTLFRIAGALRRLITGRTPEHELHHVEA